MDERSVRIFTRLREDYKYLESLGHNVLGVFLQGSQNYKLDYEESDIDTKAIIVPKFNDFVYQRKPVSTTIVLPSNEHIDLKDIRLMHECFIKQNFNFIEILFTEFRVLNPEFEEIYQPMFDNRERIAHFNEKGAINCIVGAMLEKYKALEHPYPSLVETIEKYGYDPKQLHHIIRLSRFLKSYTNRDPYEDCLVSKDGEYREFLIDVKRRSNPLFTLKEARAIAEKLTSVAKEFKDNLFENELKDYSVDVGAREIIENTVCKVLRKSFVKEIKEDI